MTERPTTSGPVAAGLGASVSSLFASFCCVGPFVVAIAGVNGAILASTLKPWRPLMLLVALGFLVHGVLRVRSLSSASETCDLRGVRTARRLLKLSGAIWLGAIVVTALTWW